MDSGWMPWFIHLFIWVSVQSSHTNSDWLFRQSSHTNSVIKKQCKLLPFTMEIAFKVNQWDRPTMLDSKGPVVCSVLHFFFKEEDPCELCLNQITSYSSGWPNSHCGLSAWWRPTAWIGSLVSQTISASIGTSTCTFMGYTAFQKNGSPCS